jgi:uncharacterized protein
MSPVFAVVAIIVFVGGLMRGFVGFGGAMVTVPALALAFGPLVAVPAAAIFGIPACIQLLPTAWRESERPIVVPICIAVMIFSPVGTYFLVTLDPHLTKMAIGALVVAMTLMLAGGWRIKGAVPRAALMGAGAVGGLVQGVAGIGGPPVVAIALSREGSPRQQRANVIGVMTAIGLSALLPIWWFGLFTTDVLIIGGVLVPVYSGATWLGSRQFLHGGERYFRVVALVLLGCVGTVTLVIAARDYLLAS